MVPHNAIPGQSLGPQVEPPETEATATAATHQPTVKHEGRRRRQPLADRQSAHRSTKVGDPCIVTARAFSSAAVGCAHGACAIL